MRDRLALKTRSTSSRSDKQEDRESEPKRRKVGFEAVTGIGGAIVETRNIRLEEANFRVWLLVFVS